MLVAGEVKGELARIHPARACCRRAQLAGLLYGEPSPAGELRTLDRATARTAVHLAASLGAPVEPPRTVGGAAMGRAGRHHLRVRLDPGLVRGWSWIAAAACDRRAHLRGILLATGSISFGARGPHVEFVLRSRAAAAELRRRLAQSGVRAAVSLRRGRHVVYMKGNDEVAELLRLAGANRALLDFETGRVGHEVRNRLNRLLNAEGANLARTVSAADRQLRAIERLDALGRLGLLPAGLRETADARRRQPDADLDALAGALGVSRSAVNHRLRRLVLLAQELGDEVAPRSTGR